MARIASRARELRVSLWRGALVAVVELLVARIRLGRIDVRSLARADAIPQDRASHPSADPERERVARATGWLIAGVARRVPWRSDCLVQALAAWRWLGRLGVDSRLHIGARKDEGGQFAAHAWLTVDGQVVTGGDVGEYTPLAASGHAESRCAS